jgi:hypothetical protein
MGLDDLLDQSQPSIAVRTPQLIEDLHLLATETTAMQSTWRYRRRGVAISMAAIALVGLGTGVAATGHLPFYWRGATGNHCSIISATASLAGQTNWNTQAFRTSTPAQRQAAVKEANRYLASYDFSAVNISAAIDEFELAWARETTATQPPRSDPAPKPVGDDLEQQAIQNHVTTDLRGHLEKLGLPFGVLEPAYEYNGAVGTDGIFRCSSE